MSLIDMTWPDRAAGSGRVERTGPAVRLALAELAPVECTRFVAEMRAALRRAERDLDTSGPDAVVRRWWVVASMLADPLSDDESAALDRARTGDLGELYYRTDAGDWAQR